MFWYCTPFNNQRPCYLIFDCDQYIHWKTFPRNVFWFRTIFAADKIFIGLFSSFRLGQKESQMEIVWDHLCHFQSKPSQPFGGMCTKSNLPSQTEISLAATQAIPLVFALGLISFGDNKFHIIYGRRQCLKMGRTKLYKLGRQGPRTGLGL